MFLLPLSLHLATAAGCTWDRWYLFSPPEAPPAPDSYVLGADGLRPEQGGPQGEAAKQLAGAHELFRKGDYVKAEALYHHLGKNTKNPVRVAEEALFYEAECQRLQGKKAAAAKTYHKLVDEFRSSAYHEQALHHMFDIANYWLDDTRQEMQLVREKREGKRWFVWPHFFHPLDPAKPLFDEEGQALETLQQVRYGDMTGPLADKALFLMAAVHFFNEDYKDADADFIQLYDLYPNSPFAEQAVELGIIAKHLSTGGSDYDGRKVAEARQLVHAALNKYPGLRQRKEEFLTNQLAGITYQQAEKDFKIAEFYRRTGHPGSAYFSYEMVRRRYPGVQPFFDLATQRMHELKAQQEKKAGAAGVPEVGEAPPPQGAAQTSR